MNETIIAVGNGGYNLAKDLISAGLFTDARLIVCDTDQTTLENASANGAKTRLLGELNGKIKSNVAWLADYIIGETTDTVIICVTLGGMTGSKYAPLIALNAILKGKFVCTLFSMPYELEGMRKNMRAENARMQLMVSSKFAIQQNNELLKTLDSLDRNEINKPLVETLKSALSNKSFVELAEEPDSYFISILKYIPEEYKVVGTDGVSLMRVRSNPYNDISEEDRKDTFDLY